MPKFITIVTGVGFLLSLVFLVGVSHYALVLRHELIDCRSSHTAFNNRRISCENMLATANAIIAVERKKVTRLQARLDASNQPLHCAALAMRGPA